MQTRRKFLRSCSLVAATAAITPTALLAQNPISRTRVAERQSFDDFARQVNSTFVLRADSESVKLTLIEARDFSSLSPEAEDAGNEKFSLRFRGPAGQPVTQDTYWFEHPRLGRLAIFIVPVNCTDAAHRDYEAIFNRPVNASDLERQLLLAPRRGEQV